MNITSMHRPGSDTTVGERSNFKKMPTHTKELAIGERTNFKIFLRTRKIMVMHSNERGECCLRTLVDRSGSVDAT